MGLELLPNWEKNVILSFHLIKNIGENFSNLSCDKMRSKSASFFTEIC